MLENIVRHIEKGEGVREAADGRNIIDVNVNNSFEPASRYYTGSGIERHVRLVISDPVRRTVIAARCDIHVGM